MDFELPFEQEESTTDINPETVTEIGTVKEEEGVVVSSQNNPLLPQEVDSTNTKVVDSEAISSKSENVSEEKGVYILNNPLLLREVGNETPADNRSEEEIIEEFVNTLKKGIPKEIILPVINHTVLIDRLMRENELRVSMSFDENKRVKEEVISGAKIIVDNLEKFVGINYADLAGRLIIKNTVYKVSDNDRSKVEIEISGAQMLVDNLEKFKGINHIDLVDRLIGGGSARIVAENPDKFTMVAHTDLVNKLVERHCGCFVVENLEKYVGIDHVDLVKKLKEVDEVYTIASNPEKFVGANQADLADWLMESYLGRDALVSNFGKFTEVNPIDLVDGLISNGHAEKIVENPDKFVGVNHIELIDRLIKEGLAERVIGNFEKFEGVSYTDLVNRLIVGGEAQTVINHLEKFVEVSHIDLVDRLIKEKRVEVAIRNLERFVGVDNIALVDRLVKEGEGGKVADNIEKFMGVDRFAIANELMEVGESSAVANNLERFPGVNHIVLVERLMEEDKAWVVAHNIEKFVGISHVNFVDRLIREGKVEVAISNLERFVGVDHIALADRLIKEGEGGKVADNLEKFVGVDHIALADRLVKEGEGGKVADNLEKFEGINHTALAHELIEVREGRKVASNIEKFMGVDRFAIANELMEAGESSAVADYLERFPGIDHIVLVERLIKEDKAEVVASNFQKLGGSELKAYSKIFDTFISPQGFLEINRLINNKPVSRELKLLGITETGEKGLEQFRNVSKELPKSFNNANIGREELKLLKQSSISRQILIATSGFGEGTWGDGGESNLLRKVESVLRSRTYRIFLGPRECYEPSEIYQIDKKDSEKVKEMFPEDVRKRYSVLMEDILGASAAVQTDGGIGKILEEVRSRIGEKYAEINRQIESINPMEEKADKKRESLVRKKQELSEYLVKSQDYSPVSYQRGVSVLVPYAELHSPLRKLVFAQELSKYPNQAEIMSRLSQDPTVESLSSVVEFIDHIVSQEMCEEYFSGDAFLAKKFGKIASTEALENGIRSRETADNMAGKTNIRFIPTKGLLLEMSGQLASACWADKYHSVGGSMPNMSAVIMQARPGEKTERIIGAALLIETTSPSTKEKVLLLRGINPRENYINTVSAESFYNAITDYVRKTAERKGMVPAIVIDDHSGGSCTNRPTLFDVTKLKKLQLEKIGVNKNSTYFNGYDVTEVSYRL